MFGQNLAQNSTPNYYKSGCEAAVKQQYNSAAIMLALATKKITTAISEFDTVIEKLILRDHDISDSTWVAHLIAADSAIMLLPTDKFPKLIESYNRRIHSALNDIVMANLNRFDIMESISEIRCKPEVVTAIKQLYYHSAHFEQLNAKKAWAERLATISLMGVPDCKSDKKITNGLLAYELYKELDDQKNQSKAAEIVGSEYLSQLCDEADSTTHDTTKLDSAITWYNKSSSPSSAREKIQQIKTIFEKNLLNSNKSELKFRAQILLRIYTYLGEKENIPKIKELL